MRYEIDVRRDTPIYRQLAESILRNIKTGQLTAGTKLPTVRELAEETGLSQGTVKHAYDYLEDLQVIEMTQGKGTFVRQQQDQDAGSRKDKAMAAIDSLFTELEDLGFTPREMEIYINLKLHGLEERYDLVKIAIIDCNPETLQLMENQLSQINYTQTAIFSLSHLTEISDKLNRDYDIILTTSSHYGEVEAFIQDKRKFAMVAMMPSMDTTLKLARLPGRTEEGIICASENFAGIIRRCCSGMADWSEVMPVHLFGGSETSLIDFLSEKDAVILPKDYEVFASPAERKLLQNFEDGGGRLIHFDYTIDRGSFLHVENLIKKIINTKRSM